ncbi:hypothetical protein THASP1DRAFT_31579 [Thamnocephalis sphaerospora]|uniref:Uncharacterized protein n=1 Tax=Thamnocephalis sphaerospora TaxID=78915 RepID=A0A4P9XL77_9FUNG|nr:hypothetical protein THASP1DRAFT_31579 [Thamnocephalis sphaerospora]|eukprot:RKP06604.1 hypothetical protein THASP1DRAFT_31579 [Thamnocephalis sphaerospora]
MAFRLGSKKVYFPSTIMKIVRSSLPPNQVAFRVEPKVNKLDRRITSTSGRQTKARDPAWKKVIVTLEEEFRYPAAPNVKRDFGGDESAAQEKRMRARLRGWKVREPRVAASAPESTEAVKA